MAPLKLSDVVLLLTFVFSTTSALNISNTTSNVTLVVDNKDPPTVDLQLNDTNITEKFVETNTHSQKNWQADAHNLNNNSLLNIYRIVAQKGPELVYEKSYRVQQSHNIKTKPPEQFFSWVKWPECKDVILKIPDYGEYNCSLGWAVAMAAVLTDRLCISSGGKTKMEFSVTELITCCDECSSGNCTDGDFMAAWVYWVERGLVTGEGGCLPLTPTDLPMERPNCTNTCAHNHGPNETSQQHKEFLRDGRIRYRNEKRKFTIGGSTIFAHKDVEQIQTEIMTNGPVQSGLEIYDDFFAYKHGVYFRTSDKKIGFHSVVIIGWGADFVENRTRKAPYWLVVNIWGARFGMNGTMKIARGINHCDIEKYAVAGIPRKAVRSMVVIKGSHPSERASVDANLASFVLVLVLVCLSHVIFRK